ncbi:MAG: hypothetical protein ABI390_05910 [Daejeonella sp.]
MSKIESDNHEIPDQKKGGKSDTVETSSFASQKEAEDFFEIAKRRLLDVSKWHSLSGVGSAEFTLTDAHGNPVYRPAKEGDYFQIDLPAAPGTDAGDGYDWVRVEEIVQKIDAEQHFAELIMRVRPAKNPKDNKNETAHFFKEEATSTFVVSLHSLEVTGEVHGRNEVPNTQQESALDIVRNAIISISAVLGFSKFQWKKLAKGFVDKEGF